MDAPPTLRGPSLLPSPIYPPRPPPPPPPTSRRPPPDQQPISIRLQESRPNSISSLSDLLPSRKSSSCGDVEIDGTAVLLLQDMIELREKCEIRKTQSRNEHQDLKIRTQHMIEALEGFMNAAGEAMAVDMTAVATMQEAWKRLQELADNTKNQRKKTDQARKEESKIEVMLLVKEKEFYSRIHGFGRDSCTPYTGPRDDYITLSRSSYSTASTTMTNATVVKEYYSKLGDMRGLIDRLYNLDSQYLRDTKVQDMQRSEGRNLGLLSRKIWRKYFEQRENIVLEFTAAKDDMEGLSRLCDDQGLSVEPPPDFKLDLNNPAHDRVHALNDDDDEGQMDWSLLELDRKQHGVNFGTSQLNVPFRRYSAPHLPVLTTQKTVIR